MLVTSIARTQQGIIANNNKLPWKNSKELKVFKRIFDCYGLIAATSKTYVCMPVSMQNKIRYIITRNKDFNLVHNTNKALLTKDNLLSFFTNYCVLVLAGSFLEEIINYIQVIFLSTIFYNHTGDTYFSNELKNFYTVYEKIYMQFRHEIKINKEL